MAGSISAAFHGQLLDGSKPFSEAFLKHHISPRKYLQKNQVSQPREEPRPVNFERVAYLLGKAPRFLDGIHKYFLTVVNKSLQVSTRLAELYTERRHLQTYESHAVKVHRHEVDSVISNGFAEHLEWQSQAVANRNRAPGCGLAWPRGFADRRQYRERRAGEDAVRGVPLALQLPRQAG